MYTYIPILMKKTKYTKKKSHPPHPDLAIPPRENCVGEREEEEEEEEENGKCDLLLWTEMAWAGLGWAQGRGVGKGEIYWIWRGGEKGGGN